MKQTNIQLIKQELDNAGFITHILGNNIIVSLNRRISVWEVELFLENNGLGNLAYAKRHKEFDKVKVVLY